MTEHRLTRIGQIESFAQVSHDDDRKLQPFALVDAHHPHNVFAFAQRSGHGQISAAVLHPFDEAQKAEQTTKIRRFILFRPII